MDSPPNDFPHMSDKLRQAIADAYLADENAVSAERIAQAKFTPAEAAATHALAREFVGRIRARRRQGRQRRRLHPGIRSFHRGRRGADVPRRGVAARAGCRDGRPADPRQDRSGRLGQPQRQVGLAVRQRFHLGADADRARHPHGPDGQLGFGRHPQEAGRPLRRAGDPPGHHHGDARAGRPVRARPDHRRSPESLARLSRERPPLFRSICSAKPLIRRPMPNAIWPPIGAASKPSPRPIPRTTRRSSSVPASR